MKREIKKQLSEAAELIADGKADCICASMGLLGYFSGDWQNEEEAKMINPQTAMWWGFLSMGVYCGSNEARQARPLGIAMMLTMPKEIVEGKCHK